MVAAMLTGWTFGLSSAGALSAVALIGYLFGRSQRKAPPADPHGGSEELQRAMRIARQLESIADELRQDLAFHRNKVDRFKTHLRQAEGEESDEAWRRLREEAENMVGPTLDLVSQLSTAYDKIRQQSQSLASFTGGRTDPLTGLANSRSLEEQLDMLLRSRASGGGESSVVVISIDAGDADRATRDQRIQKVGQQLARGLRGDDFAARYGVDDFVVVLPATSLAGARVFGIRLRKSMAADLGVSICCGLAESMPADTTKSLLGRADSAAYSARAAGPGEQYLHTGAAIKPDTRVEPAENTREESTLETPTSNEETTETAMTEESPGDESTIIASLSLAGPAVEGGLVADPAN